MLGKAATCLLLINLGAFVGAAVLPNNEGELVLLNAIFRHGARTPYAFYPNDPYINKTFYPHGLGVLTNEGKLQEYNLGKYLRNLYSDFLGEDYTEDKVYIKCTEFSRTQISAQLVMAGLFPPSEHLTWNPQLLWLPVPIYYQPLEREDIFHRRLNCPYKTNLLNDLPNHPEAYEKFMKEYEELYKYVSHHSGAIMKTPTDLGEFYFILKSEADMNLTLPRWTQSIYPEKLLQAASEVYGFFNYDKEVKKINSGYHLQRIIEDCEKKANGSIVPSSRKLVLYSGHESTIGFMLDALGFKCHDIPDYASSILFELRRRKGEHFIKIRYYKNNGDAKPIDLDIPGCTTLCPLKTFKSLVEDVMPTISVEEACNQDYTNYNEIL